MVVPPNSISFTKVAERIKDPRNYITILSTLSSVLVLYCLVLVWARRRDIKDEREVGTVFIIAEEILSHNLSYNASKYFCFRMASRGVLVIT